MSTAYADMAPVRIIVIGPQQGFATQGIPGSVSFEVVLSRSDSDTELHIPLSVTDLPTGTTVTYDTTTYPYPVALSAASSQGRAKLVVTTSETTPSGTATFTVHADGYTDAPGSLTIDTPTTPYTISGKVFEDLNGNGTGFEVGDTGLSGWMITATRTSTGAVYAPTATSTDGGTFSLPVQLGTYAVCITTQTGWQLLYPTPACRTVTITQPTIDGLVNNDFGLSRARTVSGVVFNDLNNNGVQDQNETLMSGWTITATPYIHGTIDPTRMVKGPVTTTSTGYSFAFSNADLGDWLISQTDQNGWTRTLPATQTPITVQTVGDAITYDFGNWNIPAPAPTYYGGGGGNGPITGTPLVFNSNAPQVIGFDQPIPTAPSVLGASTSCSPYITHYMRLSRRNDATDTERLRLFLNREEGMNIELQGDFDITLHNALVRFQEKYMNDILSHWGLTHGTGYAYTRTLAKINELHCMHTVQTP